MNQRVVFFVALVCIAQLGVTLTRNFWSEQSRKVQHTSLARGISQKNASASSASPVQRESLTASASTTVLKKSKPVKAASENQQPNPTAAVVSTTPRDEASTKGISTPLTPVREPVQPVTKALLPSPRSADIEAAEIATIAQQTVRDPFVPFFSVRKDSTGDANRSLSEYELNELRVTAIINDSRGGHFASVETPSGRDFIVRLGSMIGNRGGRITAILPSKVVIVEPTKSTNGSAGIIERELSLKTPAGSQDIVRTN